MEYKLKDLQPRGFFKYFEEISRIPHGSGNTVAMANYLIDFAQSHNLRHHRDGAGNVVIFKDGTAGYENKNPVILQGHMDMVCQKDADCPLDMTKDPLELVVEGDILRANGTTLGADDGIAVAMFLAILEDDTIPHPPLEVVLTNDEEIGLLGAGAMDMSMLKGRRMLNVDTFGQGSFTAGSAGGAYVTMETELDWQEYEGPLLEIQLGGLRGGHSAGAVTPAFANANQEMARLLRKLNARVVSFAGGTASNAVPRVCTAVVVADQVEDICDAHIAQLKERCVEPDAQITVTYLPTAKTRVLSQASSQKLISVLADIPNGVQEWNPDNPEQLLTSLNLGIVKLEEKLYLMTYIRSNLNSNRDALLERLKTFAREKGCTCELSGIYSAWEFRKDSPLRETMTRIFREQYGYEPTVRVTHAGLEGGAFGDKLPGLDCVSTGPIAYDVHTTRERLEISSIGKCSDFVAAILKEL